MGPIQEVAELVVTAPARPNRLARWLSKWRADEAGKLEQRADTQMAYVEYELVRGSIVAGPQYGANKGLRRVLAHPVRERQ